MVWWTFFGAVVPGLGLSLRAAGRRSEVLGVPRLCRASRSSSTRDADGLPHGLHIDLGMFAWDDEEDDDEDER